MVSKALSTCSFLYLHPLVTLLLSLVTLQLTPMYQISGFCLSCSCVKIAPTWAFVLGLKSSSHRFSPGGILAQMSPLYRGETSPLTHQLVLLYLYQSSLSGIVTHLFANLFVLSALKQWDGKALFVLLFQCLG